jgi:hypothetical protein
MGIFYYWKAFIVVSKNYLLKPISHRNLSLKVNCICSWSPIGGFIFDDAWLIIILIIVGVLKC